MAFSIESPRYLALLERVLPARTHNHVARYERVLGTSLELQIVHTGEHAGIQAEEAALAEIERLESIFSRYKSDSEFNVWQSHPGVAQHISLELAVVLEASEYWRKQTDNAFHPAADSLAEVWNRWAEKGLSVPDEEINSILCQLRRPLWSIDRHYSTACKNGALTTNLNSIAKGFIIDRACGVAAKIPGVCEVLVNIGGDLRHHGSKSLSVSVTDPFADAENAEPIDTVTICNHGLATSGNYRRGFRIGDRWYSHVFDPRTGQPVEHTVSASVIADSATAADVLATAFSVLPVSESLRLAESLPNVGCLLVTHNGKIVSNSVWDGHSTLKRAKC